MVRIRTTGKLQRLASELNKLYWKQDWKQDLHELLIPEFTVGKLNDTGPLWRRTVMDRKTKDLGFSGIL